MALCGITVCTRHPYRMEDPCPSLNITHRLAEGQNTPSPVSGVQVPSYVMGCRYFLNSKCAWYADTFEGTFEISMTCLVVFSILVRAHEPIGQSTVGMTHELNLGAHSCKSSNACLGTHSRAVMCT